MPSVSSPFRLPHRRRGPRLVDAARHALKVLLLLTLVGAPNLTARAQPAGSDPELDELLGPDSAQPPGDGAATAADSTSPSAQDTASASTQQGSGSEPATAQAPLASIPVQPLESQSEASAPQKKRQIEEIKVTAQKTEQSLQDVPISISAIDGKLMRELGANNLPDIAAYTPNVKFSSDTDPALAQVNIRGFGSSPLNAAFEASVGFVQDDIFFGRPTYFTEAIFDIDRVEVLRGPQGTLFGKNTSAGLFNVFSKSPTPEFSGDVRVGSEPEARERRVEAGAGGMFADWGGARVSVLSIDRKGTLQNTKLDRTEDQLQQEAQRLKLLFLPLDDLRTELTLVNSRTTITYWPLQLFKLSPGLRTYLEGFDPQVEDDPFNHQMSTNFPGNLSKGSETVGLKSEYNFKPIAGIEDFKLTWINGYSRIFIDAEPDADQSPADLLRLHVTSEHHQLSSEQRFSGTFPNGLFGLGQNLEFVVGGFFFSGKFGQITNLSAAKDLATFLATDSGMRQLSGNAQLGALLQSGGLGPLNPVLAPILAGVIGEDSFNLDFNQKSTTKAVFGQLIWRLSDRWTLIPGIRYGGENKKVRAIAVANCRAPPACVTQAAVSGQPYDQSSDRTETDLSPKLALQFGLTPDVNLFASYARGYKSGGINAASFSGGDLRYDAEQVKALEAGVKSTLLDRTLTFNATVFQNRFSNLQVLNIQGAAITVNNAATATARGVEADLNWLTPLQFLSVTASLGYLNARYDEYRNAPPTVDQPRGSTQDLSGRPVTFAPDYTASLSPSVMFPIYGGYGGKLTVDVLYQGGQFTDLDLDPNVYSPGHTTYSARLIFGRENGNWSLILGGSNLGDVKVANQILDTTVFPGTYAVTQQAGRKLFAALSLNW